jgi:hypothetical protein
VAAWASVGGMEFSVGWCEGFCGPFMRVLGSVHVGGCVGGRLGCWGIVCCDWCVCRGMVRCFGVCLGEVVGGVEEYVGFCGLFQVERFSCLSVG